VRVPVEARACSWLAPQRMTLIVWLLLLWCSFWKGTTRHVRCCLLLRFVIFVLARFGVTVFINVVVALILSDAFLLYIFENSTLPTGVVSRRMNTNMRHIHTPEVQKLPPRTDFLSFTVLPKSLLCIPSFKLEPSSNVCGGYPPTAEVPLLK
jgi:hypothetical protein